MGLLWSLISDPEGFVIAHWPAIALLAFACSTPWMWTTYMALARNRVAQMLVLISCACAAMWTLRGRFDNDVFAKERAQFETTLAKINSDHQAAIIAAQTQNDKDAEINRSTLAAALVKAATEKGNVDAKLASLQQEIDAMPDVDTTPKPTKDCKVPPPPRIDPTILKILRSK